MRNINKYIGIKAEELRETTDYNQEDLANILGMTRCNYVNLIRGRINWTAEKIVKLCQLYNVDPGIFFPYIEPIKPKEIKKKIRIVKIKMVYKPI